MVAEAVAAPGRPIWPSMAASRSASGFPAAFPVVLTLHAPASRHDHGYAWPAMSRASWRMTLASTPQTLLSHSALFG